MLAQMGVASAAEPNAGATNPADLSIVELLPMLERRWLSARELVEACVARGSSPLNPVGHGPDSIVLLKHPAPTTLEVRG